MPAHRGVTPSGLGACGDDALSSTVNLNVDLDIVLCVLVLPSTASDGGCGAGAPQPGSRESRGQLAEGGEVDDRAADEGRGDLERALAGCDRGEDVGVAGELGRRDAGVPVEDLQVPRAAGVPDLGGDEVEHVAGTGVVREGGLGACELHGWHGPAGVDDVEDDVAGREHLGLLRRRGDLHGGLVLDRLVVVVGEAGSGSRRERGGGGRRERGGGGREQPGEGEAREQEQLLQGGSSFVAGDASHHGRCGDQFRGTARPAWPALATSHMSNSAPARLWIAFSGGNLPGARYEAGGSSPARVWGTRTQAVRAVATNTGCGRHRRPRAAPRRPGKSAGAGRSAWRPARSRALNRSTQAPTSRQAPCTRPGKTGETALDGDGVLLVTQVPRPASGAGGRRPRRSSARRARVPAVAWRPGFACRPGSFSSSSAWPSSPITPPRLPRSAITRSRPQEHSSTSLVLSKSAGACCW